MSTEGRVYSIQPIEVEISYERALAKNLFVNPDEIDSVKIQYTKPTTPTATVGEWVAILDKVNKKIVYVGDENSSYGQVGKWKFVAFVTLLNGKTYPTSPIYEEIYAL